MKTSSKSDTDAGTLRTNPPSTVAAATAHAPGRQGGRVEGRQAFFWRQGRRFRPPAGESRHEFQGYRKGSRGKPWMAEGPGSRYALAGVEGEQPVEQVHAGLAELGKHPAQLIVGEVRQLRSVPCAIGVVGG